jgi:hypothetical protein
MSEPPPRRARTLAEFGENADKMFRREEIGASIGSYRPRPTDVIISPFAKCGTTWLQQIFHTLRTRGDMDFSDISEVVPWIETAVCLGVDLEAPQRAEPRGFKSHLPFDKMPKGARYIVALRDPKDALVSFYRFMEGWFFEPGSIGFEDFAQARLAGSTAHDGYWHHLNSWWAQRDNPDVLLMSYEQMIADPAARIRRVAAFCGIPLDAELLALTLERSSLAFMLQHKTLFDDTMMRQASELRCNLPPGGDSAKVRKGGSGGYLLEMPASMVAAVDAKWAELTAPVVGFASYAALEAELRRRGQA